MEEFNFIDEFTQQMKDKNIHVVGVISQNKKIYTLGTDSKLIGRVFEMVCQPIIDSIALKHGLKVKTPSRQNYYPDFILEDPIDHTKIAIDVKSTYRSSKRKKVSFTLGAFSSFMRDNQKNLVGFYTDYQKHYVIGFVYRRNAQAQYSQEISIEELNKIPCPFILEDFFVQEKYKIAGEKKGSGNTDNIGSIKTDIISDFKDGCGPFSILGENMFHLYWTNYPTNTEKNKRFSDLKTFYEAIKNGLILDPYLYPLDYEALLKQLSDYFEDELNEISES